MGTRTWSNYPPCAPRGRFPMEIMALPPPLGSTPPWPQSSSPGALTQSQGPCGVRVRNHSFRTRKSREGQGRYVHAQSTVHTAGPGTPWPHSHTSHSATRSQPTTCLPRADMSTTLPPQGELGFRVA